MSARRVVDARRDSSGIRRLDQSAIRLERHCSNRLSNKQTSCFLFVRLDMLSAGLVRRSLAMSSAVTSAPFSRAVVSAMRKLYVLLTRVKFMLILGSYPEALADKSWDNTGREFPDLVFWSCLTDIPPVLLEAPFNPKNRKNNSVLLTVDLTKAVADEAIERQDSIVVAYRQSYFQFLI